MFVRFRHNRNSLQVSLVETRRIDGAVRHEHIASFGSVERPPSVETRIAFWQRLHERLANLSNRVDASMQLKILSDIHRRIPIATLDEKRALLIEYTKADEQFWASLHDMHAANVGNNNGLATSVERTVLESQAEMAKALEARDFAKDRRERLERGEDVPFGFAKPFALKDTERVLRDQGFTASEIQQCFDLNTLAGRMDWDVIM